MSAIGPERHLPRVQQYACNRGRSGSARSVLRTSLMTPLWKSSKAALRSPRGKLAATDSTYPRSIRSEPFYTDIEKHSFNSFLALRGVKTLALRMERQSASALRIAHWLAEHPRIRRVHYPGLGSHPQHELARRQMRTFGAMISVEVAGSPDDARRFLECCRLFTLAESLGGVESLISLPALMTHASTPREVRAAHRLFGADISRNRGL